MGSNVVDLFSKKQFSELDNTPDVPAKTVEELGEYCGNLPDSYLKQLRARQQILAAKSTTINNFVIEYEALREEYLSVFTEAISSISIPEDKQEASEENGFVFLMASDGQIWRVHQDHIQEFVDLQSAQTTEPQ